MNATVTLKNPAVCLLSTLAALLIVFGLASASASARPPAHLKRHGHDEPARHKRHRHAKPPRGRRDRPVNGRRDSSNGPATPLVHVILTTRNLAYALTSMPAQTFTASPAKGADVIDVNPAIRYQQMLGFGAAMTDASAWLLYDELTPQARAQAMQALFSPQGINLDYIRIPMGGSDYTVGNPYTYDDVAAGQTDPAMAGFSIAHDESYIIPALQQMLRVSPGVFTLANPWTAPPWMKQNQTYDNVGWAGVVNPQYYPALAQYFADFIADYRAAGVPIDAITPMNEPNSASTWPGTNLTAADDATFIPNYLAPALTAAGEHPAIYGDDDSELADADTLLSGPAGPDLSGMAFHCYQGLPQLSALHEQYPSVQILVNECSPGIIPYATAEVPIDAARNWASGVQLWNLALDPSGGPYGPNMGCPHCTGVLTVSEKSHEAYDNLNYYQLGQTSKYVQRGATRIDSTRDVTSGYGISQGVDNVAFQNPDGSFVLVAYNNSSGARKIAIDWAGRYTSFTLPAAGTVTFTWR